MCPIARLLREYVAVTLVAPSLLTAARACRVSPRSLQRELTSRVTRFSSELSVARVRAACGFLQS